MHIVTLPSGQPACYHCRREFERHPSEERREKDHDAVCAMKDDDAAARLFHFQQQTRTQDQGQTTVWLERELFDIPGVGFVEFEGVEFRLAPGVAAEAVIPVVDELLMPSIRKSIIEALDGTLAARQAEFRALVVTLEPQDQLWRRDTPSVEEMYPFGYVRNADGSVDAVQGCKEQDPAHAQEDLPAPGHYGSPGYTHPSPWVLPPIDYF
jgi:hypothetical protein